MGKEYEVFMMVDRPFHDPMYSERTASVSCSTAARPLPDDWQCSEQDDWFVIDPGTAGLPAQGWKIHTFTTLDNAERVLDAVWDYPQDIHFKFLKARPDGSGNRRWRAGISGSTQPVNCMGDLFGVGGPTLSQACVDV